MRFLLLAALALGPACNCGLDVLETPRPHMIVQPQSVDIGAAPVAQDTRIVIQVSDPTIVNLSDVHAELQEPVDPRFTLVQPTIDEVLAGQTGEIVVIVRPVVPTDLKATLVITAEENAKPNRVEVPITVHAIDAGLPDICDYPSVGATGDPKIEFGSVGQNSVATFQLHMDNCGIRDLLIDSVTLCTDPEAADCGTVDAVHDAAFATVPLPPGFPIGPGEQGGISVQLSFNPPDLVEHTTNVVIHSNDPDEEPIVIPVSGTGAACPVACIEVVDDGSSSTGVEPFDTVLLDGRCSTAPEGATTSIDSYTWTLDPRPVGSTAVLSSETADRVELPVDIAGRYCVNLDVTDTGGVRSCAPAQQCIDVVPKEDLHLQLVWDHPSADLDLHLIGDNGTAFTHESDCYFSNRHPTPDSCAADAAVCSWVDNPDQNPNLDHDDSEGYGPENINITHPAPGSHWKLLVHYWNKQTDGDARTTATVRVFVYGQQVMEIQFTFEDDQTLWEAVDITWPETQGEPASLAQIGVVQPFPRPF